MKNKKPPLNLIFYFLLPEKNIIELSQKVSYSFSYSWKNEIKNLGRNRMDSFITI